MMLVNCIKKKKTIEVENHCIQDVELGQLRLVAIFTLTKLALTMFNNEERR